VGYPSSFSRVETGTEPSRNSFLSSAPCIIIGPVGALGLDWLSLVTYRLLKEVFVSYQEADSKINFINDI